MFVTDSVVIDKYKIKRKKNLFEYLPNMGKFNERRD